MPSVAEEPPPRRSYAPQQQLRQQRGVPAGRVQGSVQGVRSIPQPAAVAAAAVCTQWYAASFSQQRQAYQTSAAIPAAPSQDEVAIVGYRSRQERDAEARRHAIDLDSESETTPGKAEACAAEAKPASKLTAKPAKIAEPAARSRPATKLAARSA